MIKLLLMFIIGNLTGISLMCILQINRGEKDE